jgi:ABC-2 type transport system permease protein
MKARPMLAVALRQFYLMRGSPTRIVPTFTWVAVDIILWGFISRYFSAAGGGHDLVPQLLGAVLFWDFFTRVMQGISVAFLEDIWSRNFLNFFATPLTIGEYVCGLVLTSVCTSLVGLIVMLVLATSVFGLQFAALGAWLVPYLLVLFLFGIALGIIASAIVLRLGPASEWLVWPIPALLAPFAGVFYPLATLPGWMQAVAWFLPPAHVFEGMRALLAAQPHDAHWLVTGLVLALLQIVLAGWLFRQVYRHAVRSGLLARYSAESV